VLHNREADQKLNLIGKLDGLTNTYVSDWHVYLIACNLILFHVIPAHCTSAYGLTSGASPAPLSAQRAAVDNTIALEIYNGNCSNAHALLPF
jgi:hypothetical protein